MGMWVSYGESVCETVSVIPRQITFEPQKDRAYWTDRSLVSA